MKIVHLMAVAAVSGAFIAGCGSDSGSSSPAQSTTGQVVKGPVVGAKITFAGYTASTTTGSDGKYTVKKTGVKITSTGGSYVDLATNTTKTAPTLLAPAGSSNVTPLTTMVANDTTGTLKAAIEKLGIKFDDALSTVTSTNKNAILLNELAGTIVSAGVGANSSVISALVTQLATATSSTTTAQIATLVNTALTNAAKADTTITTIVSTLNANISAMQAAVDKLSTGPLPTGSTGGSSTTTF